MVKNNQGLLNKLHIFLDLIVIILSYALTWFLKFELPLFENESGGVLSKQIYFEFLIIIVPIFMFWYYFFRLYAPKRTSGLGVEISGLAKANVAGIISIYSMLYLMKEQDYSRTFFFYFVLVNLLISSIYRAILRVFLHSIRAKGFNQKHILLVGFSSAAEGYIDRVSQNPEWGYSIYGFLDDHVEANFEYDTIKCLGKIDKLEEILNVNNLDEIAITVSLHDYDKLESIVNICEKSGVHTKFIPDYNSMIPTKAFTEDLMGLPVIHIRHVPLTNTANIVIKRMVDILGGCIALLLFSPIMILCTILIKLSSNGPLLFKQERIGLHNKPFMMYKFRSMQMQTVEDEANGWTIQNDPRITKIGRIMRKTSLDELPQLFNILKGEMSLVGPRPERPQFVEKFKEQIPRYMIKHQVRPGMTGWAQINGFRGDTSIRKRIDCDIYYIENWTLQLDIRILIVTIFKGFINKNAY